MKLEFSSYQNWLYSDSDVPADVSPLVDDGYLVNQRNWIQKIAQVDKGAANETKPWEAIIEGIAPSETLDVVIG
jgi:hypothetical protein